MIKHKQSHIPFLLILILLITTKSGFACSGSPPTADFNVDNTTPVVGESIEFSDNSTNGTTALGATDRIDTWNWDFGSGAIHSVTGNNQATGQGTHTVTYSTSGLKAVSLEVITAGNRNDTETKNDFINVGLAPTPGSIGTNQTICSGDTPDELTSEADGGGSVNTSIVYEWETDASGVWATIPGETGSTYQPPPLSNTTSYRRRTETDWGGSIRYSGYTNEVLITVNPLPTAPTAGNINITYDGTLHTGTATPPSGSSVIWYDAATGGSVTTAPSRTDVGTSSAWGESEVDATGCKSTTRTEVTVTVTKKRSSGYSSGQ